MPLSQKNMIYIVDNCVLKNSLVMLDKLFSGRMKNLHTPSFMQKSVYMKIDDGHV